MFFTTCVSQGQANKKLNFGAFVMFACVTSGARLGYPLVLIIVFQQYFNLIIYFSHVSFVDCPGHDILMATMLNGAAVMDAALLMIGQYLFL